MTYKQRQQFIAHSILLLGSFIVLYPFFSILFLALSEPGKRITGFTIPERIHFENFITAWNKGGFGQALWGSTIIVIAVVSVAVICSTFAAYAFEKLKPVGSASLFGLLLVGLVLPYESIMIPLYYMMKNHGFANTYWTLILPQIGLSIPFGTFWMRASFKTIPPNLSEAAMIEGAGRWTILTKILLPQVYPALLTLMVLLFMWTWNEFLLALVMIQDNSIRTAPLALSYFAGNKRTGDPAVTAAAAILVALPILIAYIFLQRRFISGMISGAIKE